MLAMVMCGFGVEARLGIGVGLAIMIAHHLYLRPGELFRLTWGDLWPAKTRGRFEVAAVLHAREKQISSKTGNFDEATLIDDRNLARAVAAEKLRHRSSDLLVPCAPADFQKMWDRAVRECGLERTIGRQHLYVLRH